MSLLVFKNDKNTTLWWRRFSVSKGEYLCGSRMGEVTSNNHRKFTFTLLLLFTHKNVSEPWIHLLKWGSYRRGILLTRGWRHWGKHLMMQMKSWEKSQIVFLRPRIDTEMKVVGEKWFRETCKLFRSAHIFLCICGFCFRAFVCV